MNEQEIKALLVKELLRSENEILLASEFPYSNGSRRCDILTIENDILTAYEIKSDRDSFRKLDAQVQDYKKSFDYTYLVTTEQKLENSRYRPKGIGVIILDSEKKLITKKKPPISNNTDLSEQLTMLKIKELKKMSGLTKKNSETKLDFIQKIVKYFDKTDGTFRFKKELKNNLLAINSLFKEYRENNSEISLDDLKILEMRSSIITI